ncbi:MAG: chaperone NapD [bacterium]|nr:chaperone NapD [bacterium]
MIVAGVVIQTIPQQAAAVVERLVTVPGLDVLDHDGDNRIAAVWTGESGETLEALGEELVASDEAVLGIYPTFAGEENEE